MSNKNWFDSILSIFSSKEEGCYSCLNGLDCPQHKVTLAKGVDQAKLSTPGLKQLAKDIADAQQVLSKDTKDLEEAKAELTRAENTLQFQEELYSMSVKLVEDIAETRISAADKKEAIKAKNLAINANDQVLSQWATISLEQRIADATARIQKAAPTVSAPPTPVAPTPTATAPAAPAVPATAHGNGATRREPEAEKESKYGPTKWDTAVVPKLQAIGIAKSRIDTLGQKAKEGNLKKCLDWAQADRSKKYI